MEARRRRHDREAFKWLELVRPPSTPLAYALAHTSVSIKIQKTYSRFYGSIAAGTRRISYTSSSCVVSPYRLSMFIDFPLAAEIVGASSFPSPILVADVAVYASPRLLHIYRGLVVRSGRASGAHTVSATWAAPHRRAAQRGHIPVRCRNCLRISSASINKNSYSAPNFFDRRSLTDHICRHQLRRRSPT